MNRTIAQEIKHIRTLLRLSQEKFADHFNAVEPRTLKTRQQDISRYELGIMTPTTRKYKKFLSLIK